MSKTKTNGVFVATESFSADIEGVSYSVVKGETRIRGDHPLLNDNADYFKSVEDEVTFETADHRPSGKRRGPKPAEKSEETDEQEPADDEQEPVQDDPEAASEPGDTEDASAGEEPADEAEAVDLDKTRAELNALAVELGIESPDKFANKGEVVSAIEAVQSK